MFLGERVILFHLQVGIVKLEVLASGVGNGRLHLGVMPVSVEALPNLEGICVLAKSLLHLGGDVVGGLALFRESTGALQPHGVANLVLGDGRLLLIVAALLLLLPERLSDLAAIYSVLAINSSQSSAFPGVAHCRPCSIESFSKRI